MLLHVWNWQKANYVVFYSFFDIFVIILHVGENVVIFMLLEYMYNFYFKNHSYLLKKDIGLKLKSKSVKANLASLKMVWHKKLLKKY